MGTNLKEVQKIAEKFQFDKSMIAQELKNVQSLKHRLKLKKYMVTYESKMSEVLKYEQVLKEARALVDPKDKAVTQYEQADIDLLDFEQTVRAIKSIQSKKTNTKYLTVEPGEHEDYKAAVIIEQMLLAHKETVQPVDEQFVRKTDIQTILETIQMTQDITVDTIVNLLQDLVGETMTDLLQDLSKETI